MMTVARCVDIQEAVRLKLALEASGITVFIPDENTAYNAPQRFLTTPSGVRVQVAEKDEKAAKDILSEQAKL